MTMHLQETAEAEYLGKFVKFRMLRAYTYYVTLVGANVEIEEPRLSRLKKENKRRVAAGNPPKPLTRPVGRTLSLAELQDTYFIQEVEVKSWGGNPPVRVRIWSPESGSFDFELLWNKLDDCFIFLNEEEPTKEEGRIYDVKRRW